MNYSEKAEQITQEAETRLNELKKDYISNKKGAWVVFIKDNIHGVYQNEYQVREFVARNILRYVENISFKFYPFLDL